MHEAPPLSDWPHRQPPSYSTVQIDWVDTTGFSARVFSGIIYQAPVSIESGAHWIYCRIQSPSLAAKLNHRRIEGYERTVDGETVSQTIRRIFAKYAVGEGITTDNVFGSDVPNPDVYDYITLKEFLDRLRDETGSIWSVNPFGTLEFRPTGALSIAPFTITADNIETLEVDDDLQRHRTRQTAIGATPVAGQITDTFMGNGSQREFQLRYRLDQIIELSVNGVSSDYGGEDDGYRWIVDHPRSTLSLRDGYNTLQATDELKCLYDYRGPILITRDDSVSVNNYGIVHNVIQDASIETNEEAESIVLRELDRHNNPNSIIRARTLYQEIPSVEEGTLIPVNIPLLGIFNERWLCTSAVMLSEGDGSFWDLELTAHDYEELGEDWWVRNRKLTTPTEPPTPIMVGGGRSIDPNVLLHEGLKLPAPLAGSELTLRSDNNWSRIPGGGQVPLDGLRLPVDSVEISFTAMVYNLPPGVIGEVRLYNVTDSTQVGNEVVVVTSSVPAPYFIRNLTLAGKTAIYELQSRCSADAGRGAGLAVWNSRVDVSGV